MEEARLSIGRSVRARHLCVSLAALCGLLAPAGLSAENEEPIWALLRAGGQVVLIRHTITVAGSGDPPGMRLDDCSTQRNLTDEGRAHARRVGMAFRARGVEVSRLLSSPWCRCVETARLAFGQPEVWPALGNLFGRPENREAQVSQMRRLVSLRGEGNLVLVSHGSTISALTGTNPGVGEMIVVTPLGDGDFVVAGKLVVP
jgi:phosphohistidine phosphatase SixA